jgi:hypothetical protein
VLFTSGGALLSGSRGFEKTRSGPASYVITEWLIHGAVDNRVSSTGGIGSRATNCGGHCGVINHDNNMCESGNNCFPQELKSTMWRDGDFMHGRMWSNYKDNGKLKSRCGGCNWGQGVNLDCHFSGSVEEVTNRYHPSNVYAWAKTYIYAEQDTTVSLQGGSDDGYTMHLIRADGTTQDWTNRQCACRCYRTAQETYSGVVLKKGWNQLLVKTG